MFIIRFGLSFLPLAILLSSLISSNGFSMIGVEFLSPASLSISRSPLNSLGSSSWKCIPFSASTLLPVHSLSSMLWSAPENSNEIKNSDNDENKNSNNSSNEDENSSSSWDGNINPLLGMVMDRAMNTLSSRKSYDSYAGRNMDNLKNPSLSSSVANVEGYQRPSDNENNKGQHDNNTSNNAGFSYLGNPNVTPTALAQSLWRDVIIPNVDTVIDATCGNGKDASALAQMLFPPTDGIIADSSNVDISPELICIDIQERACRNTQQSLIESLEQNNNIDAWNKYVRVLHTSHAPLPMPRSKQSVGLICYNLGYLPGNDDNGDEERDTDIDILTQTQTTLQSLSQAAPLLRVGGLLSVLTYPGSNAQEASAVHSFCTGLAMFSTRSEGGWEGHLSSTVGEDDITYLSIYQALKSVKEAGPKKQTWRVLDHRPLGRPNSPILITALRIK